MLFITVALFLGTINNVLSACDNQCSGHGTCGSDDVCQCYDNWGVGLNAHDSGDCSERRCPFEIAWVDNPNKAGKFHKYAECAGRGLCDRTTAECLCFDGYEGKGCQRMSCPNDCSGHGTCEYINDLGYGATWNDYTTKYFSDDLKLFRYPQWDSYKTRGCVCDPLYGDVDCSKKMCPFGTDVLDHRDNLLVSTKYQVQNFQFVASSHDNTLPVQTGNTDDTGTLEGSLDEKKLNGKTFAFTFKSKLNESFTTIPIVFNDNNLPNMVHDIQLALLTLPNRVIDGVTVAAHRDYATILHVNISFTGQAVQGPQHLLVVEDYECSSGCTPRLTGLNLQTRYDHTMSNATEARAADFNSYECGRRGSCDYSSGLCACFAGYVGENCNTLTTLV